MMRKKTALHVDQRLGLMLENAYYASNPPDRAAITAKIRPPHELYLRKLIYKDLNIHTAEQILRQLRKFNWSDPDVRQLLKKTFLRVWKLKYANIDCLAWLLYQLAKFYPAFGISVVDAVLEEMRLGMEINRFQHNQRRVSIMRYLGELYNYRLIGHALVFDCLYLLLRFGHGALNSLIL
jgi:regulator of nonsense transcripts 2